MNEEPRAPYHLGVDLGTTFTSAAVWVNGEVEVVDLGNRATQMPSVVFLSEDGTFAAGETAERRALSDPVRVVREFKRRIGDTTPIVLGGVPCSADMLMGELLRSVVATVTDRYRGAPTSIALSHPASWGPYKLDLLQQSARIAECGEVTLISEPEAAVRHYSNTERLEPGSVLAVYDFGGGTFDAAVVRKGADATVVLGRPDGVEHLGGADFDQDVLRLVLGQFGDAAEQLDHDDPLVQSSLLRLRDECRDAKEGLSVVDTVSVPVMLPGIQSTATVSRDQFEETIRPAVEQTLVALRRSFVSAEVAPEDLHAVLLAGGSSRIPLVQQMVSAEIGGPVALDAHPKYVVAMGAVLAAAGTDVAPEGPEEAVSVFVPGPESVPLVDAAASPNVTVFETTPEPAVTQTMPVAPGVEDAPAKSGVPWLPLAIAAVLFAGVAGAFFVFGSDDTDPSDADSVIADGTDNDEVDAPDDQLGDEGESPTAVVEPSPEPEPTAPSVNLPVPLRTIQVGVEPDTPLLAGDFLWLPNAGSDTLSRIDQDTGEVQEVIVGARPDTAIFAEGAIWVPVREDGLLARVDPIDGTVTTTPVGVRADTPVFDGERLWLPVRGTDELHVIDPVDGSIMLTIGLAGRPLTPILVDGSLWFVTRDDNALHRIDLAAVDLPTTPALDTVQVGADPDRPVAAGAMIWIPNRDDATVSVVDPATLAVVATVEVGDTPDTPVVAGGRVWVPNSGSTTVTVIDAATFEVVATVEVGARPRTGVATDDSVWIPVADANLVVQLDIGQAELIQRFLTGTEPDTPALIGDSIWVPNAGSASVLELQVR